jgi:hypothetical protein
VCLYYPLPDAILIGENPSWALSYKKHVFLLARTS